MVLNGLSGEVVVNGRVYDAFMPALHHLDDEHIADILTYALAELGGSEGVVTPDEVAAVRARVRGEWREPAPRPAR